MNNSYRGFTFLEMMVALSVIAIALVSMLASQSQSVSLSTEARFMTTAALLAQNKMAEFSLKKGEDLRDESGTFGEDFPDYFWELRVEDVSFAGAEEFTKYLKKLDLNIYRGEKKRYQYSLSLYSFIP